MLRQIKSREVTYLLKLFGFDVSIIVCTASGNYELKVIGLYFIIFLPTRVLSEGAELKIPDCTSFWQLMC